MKNDYFVDLHIHIGRSATGRPVKISAAKDLTLLRIIEVAAEEKGMDMIGIIDAHVPEIQNELHDLIHAGLLSESTSGGLKFQNVSIILGSEIEIMDEGYRPVHYLCYFPTLENIQHFTQWISSGMKNITLSSQRLYKSSRELQKKVKELDGLFIPAHIFTPFKGIYGSAVHKMEEILHLEWVDAVELGLSGDTDMADTIKELEHFTFVTNSDAHSLGKIAREYQKIQMTDTNFIQLQKALHRDGDNKIVANYGLSPQLGKYHISVCLQCDTSLESYCERCPHCQGKVLKGVAHRIKELAMYEEPVHPKHRPSYIQQVPLDFLPGVGKKTYSRLLEFFSTEMNILHYVPLEQIRDNFGESLASTIRLCREGLLQQEKGGGGVYGRVIPIK